MVAIKDLASAIGGLMNVLQVQNDTSSFGNGVKNLPGYDEYSVWPGPFCTNSFSKFDLVVPADENDGGFNVAWEHGVASGDAAPNRVTPIVGGDVYHEQCAPTVSCPALIVSTGSEHPTLNKNSMVQSFLANGHSLWKFKSVDHTRGFIADPITSTSSSYVVAGDLLGLLYVLNKGSGVVEKVWNLGGEVRASPVSTKYGNLFAVASGKNAVGSGMQDVPSSLYKMSSPVGSNLPVFTNVCNRAVSSGKNWTTVSAPLLVAEQGDLVLVRCDDLFWEAYNSLNMELKWREKFEQGALFDTVAVNTKKGGYILLSLGNNLAKIESQTGNVLWTVELATKLEGIVLDQDRELAYLLLGDGTLQGFDVLGKNVTKSKKLSEFQSVFSSQPMTLDQNGILLVGSTRANHLIDVETFEDVVPPIPLSAHSNTGPVIGPDGSIYRSTTQHYLQKYELQTALPGPGTNSPTVTPTPQNSESITKGPTPSPSGSVKNLVPVTFAGLILIAFFR